jgi:hypothetical protein
MPTPFLDRRTRGILICIVPFLGGLLGLLVGRSLAASPLPTYGCGVAGVLLGTALLGPPLVLGGRCSALASSESLPPAHRTR